MTYKFSASRKGLHIVTSITEAKTNFPTDGTQPTISSAVRVQNLDTTAANGVYVLVGKAADVPVADTSCHYIPGGQAMDFRKKDTDDCISVKAAAGTPAINVHFGSAGLAD